MTTSLEDRLRTQYRATADELDLPPMTWDDVLARELHGRSPERRGQRWLVAASVAALVVGTTIGGAALLRSRSEDTGEASIVTAAPGSASPFVECPAGSVPAHVPDGEYPNDIRINNAVLPAETPVGYCVLDHQVWTIPYDARPYTVWVSCDDCDDPTAAIARTVPGDRSERATAGPAEETDVAGRPGRYYPPDDKEVVARLFTTDSSGNDVLYVGWGLSSEEMVSLAASTSDDADADPAGLARVFDGALGVYEPARFPLIGTLAIGYYDTAGSSALSFDLVQGEFTPSPDAFVWLNPDVTITEIDGRRSVLVPATSNGNDLTWTAAIVSVDAEHLVIWTETGVDPAAADELAALPVSPAAVDDVRWAEIAYESGMYDAQG